MTIVESNCTNFCPLKAFKETLNFPSLSKTILGFLSVDVAGVAPWKDHSKRVAPTDSFVNSAVAGGELFISNETENLGTSAFQISMIISFLSIRLSILLTSSVTLYLPSFKKRSSGGVRSSKEVMVVPSKVHL